MLIVSVSVIAIISTVYMHVYMCGVKYLGRHQNWCFCVGVGKVSRAKWGSIQGNLAGTEDLAGGAKAKKEQPSKVVTG